jgi:hypothetical protein
MSGVLNFRIYGPSWGSAFPGRRGQAKRRAGREGRGKQQYPAKSSSGRGLAKVDCRSKLQYLLDWNDDRRALRGAINLEV